jgi:hypothetical protein
MQPIKLTISLHGSLYEGRGSVLGTLKLFLVFACTAIREVYAFAIL